MRTCAIPQVARRKNLQPIDTWGASKKSISMKQVRRQVAIKQNGHSGVPHDYDFLHALPQGPARWLGLRILRTSPTRQLRSMSSPRSRSL